MQSTQRRSWGLAGPVEGIQRCAHSTAIAVTSPILAPLLGASPDRLALFQQGKLLHNFARGVAAQLCKGSCCATLCHHHPHTRPMRGPWPQRKWCCTLLCPRSVGDSFTKMQCAAKLLRLPCVVLVHDICCTTCACFWSPPGALRSFSCHLSGLPKRFTGYLQQHMLRRAVASNVHIGSMLTLQPFETEGTFRKSRAAIL